MHAKHRKSVGEKKNFSKSDVRYAYVTDYASSWALRNNVHSPDSGLYQVWVKNFKEYRDISKNFLLKDGMNMSAQWIHYFFTMT